MKGGIFLNIGSYEINNETLVIMPFGKNQSKVYEISGDFIVNMSPLNIIKASCLYFGSSYEGRKESAKYTAGIEMKVPVLIEESRNIIFFPTTSCINAESIWISFQNLVRYNKISDKDTLLIFRENRQLKVNIRYNLVDNQVVRCIKIDTLLKRRKEFLDSNNFVV